MDDQTIARISIKAAGEIYDSLVRSGAIEPRKEILRLLAEIIAKNICDEVRKNMECSK